MWGESVERNCKPMDENRKESIAGGETAPENAIGGWALPASTNPAYPGSDDLNFSNHPVRTGMPGGARAGDRSATLTAPLPIWLEHADIACFGLG